MYEYVQTPTGWVLFWGSKSLYREVEAAAVLPVQEAAVAEAAGSDRDPMQTLSA